MTRLLLGLIVLVVSCRKPEGSPGGSTVDRCSVDLGATGLFSTTGTSSKAQLITSSSQLIGGEGATGRSGDVLLQNDKIRVVIEQPGRTIGPILSGGHIIDADIQRGQKESGRDAFGRMNLIYSMGRFSSVHRVEIVNDGTHGGPAVVASTGHDTVHDVLNLKSLIEARSGLKVMPVVDQNKPVSIRTTTYYVLSPGESRVRILTAFCNDDPKPLFTPLIEVMDMGAPELFFFNGCTNGLGSSLDVGGCSVQSSEWVAAQGDRVAYGYRPMALEDLKRVSGKNAMIGYGGVVGVAIEGENLSGLLKWTDANADSRPGTFAIRQKGVRLALSDFFVGEDIAHVSSAMHETSKVPVGTVNVETFQEQARVSVSNSQGVMQTLLVTDAAGHGVVQLPEGKYNFTGTSVGRLIGQPVTVDVKAGTEQTIKVPLSAIRRLRVSVRDESGAPCPGKVVVRCSPVECPFSPATWKQHVLIDPPAEGSAAVEYVGVSGESQVLLPPGKYEVIVSRGPEFSVWPSAWPKSGQAIDLTENDAQVTATVVHVIDSTGWMSADLHVHAVNSSDSTITNVSRVENFLAEGVDVLLSTDHDHITDFAPTVKALGAEQLIATMMGEEVTSFSHGHFNAYPVQRKSDLPNGGAFDHAGGEDGPTLRLSQLFDGLRHDHPGVVVQLNHPRGSAGGVLSQLKVDTASLRSHGLPAEYSMAPDPTATADDSKLFSATFDVIETANGPTASFAVLNDWMTFLSRGTVRAASGVSDTHNLRSDNGGYARTYAQVGVDRPSEFQASKFADAMRKQSAFVTNGPFIRFSAKVVQSGSVAEMGQTLKVGANEDVELLVDVTALEWMNIDRIELYTHAQGREALNGEPNEEWPESRIYRTHAIATPTYEAVPGHPTLKRQHLQAKFTVRPTFDTWFVAMARATQGANLWPLHASRAQAYTNAILIDADGSGNYDDFPLKVSSQSLRSAPKAKEGKPVVPTPAQAEAIIRSFLVHSH